MDYTWALNQTAVYWERLGPDGYGGWAWEDPVEISVRWVDKNEKFVGTDGEDKISRAKVLLNQDVAVGDALYLGNIDDLDSSADPGNVEGAYLVRQFDKVPDILAEEYLKRAWL